MLNKLSLGLILLLLLVVNFFRFWHLDQVPYGFNVDEMSGAVSVQCLATQGTDAHLIPHPIFFEQHYGTPKPPVYAYPAALWTNIFGHTVDHLRSFTAFFNVLTILGIFFLGRLILNSSYGLLAALIATLSPWAWGLSRIGYESTFCATFLVWGIFFFLQSNQWKDKLIAAFLFACAIYVYPPARLHSPMILLTLFLFDYKRQGINKKVLIGFAAALFIFCIPLAHHMFFGNLQQRFNEISIFNPDYFKSIGEQKTLFNILKSFAHNYALHFNPQYLFVTGDPSWEHSTQHFGQFSWVEMLGLAALAFFLIFKMKDVAVHKRWLIFIAVNFFLGIVPASLTSSGLPNNLRTISAFPFSCFLSAFGLWMLCERLKFFWPIVVILSGIFGFLFLRTYFTIYPDQSKGWFSFWTKEEALNAKTNEDWLKFMIHYREDDYHFRYYLMNYHGDSCSESRTQWMEMRRHLGLPKAY